MPGRPGRASTLAVAALTILGGLALPPVDAAAAGVRVTPRASCPAELVPPGRFDDTVGHPRVASIDCLVWWGLDEGTSATTFGPELDALRGEVATVLVRVLDRTHDRPNSAPPSFTDTAGNAHAEDIDLIAAAGIVPAGGAFRPDDPITRAELSGMLDALLSGVYGVELAAAPQRFEDVPPAHPRWGAVHRLVTGRVITGPVGSSFEPDQGATRALLARFVTRTVGLLVGAREVEVPLSITPRSRCTTPAPRTAAEYQALFAGRWGSEWAAADGAHTIPLPDGRTMWTWGDTMQGVADEQGAWAPGWRMIRNSVLVQDRGCLTALLGADGEDTVPQGPDGEFYWPSNGILIGDRIYAQAYRLAPRSPESDSFEVLGSDLVRFRAPSDGASPEFDTVLPTPSSDWASGSPNVAWGFGMWSDGSHIYLYGILTFPCPDCPRLEGLGKELHIARVPIAQIEDLSAWRFRTATGWSSSHLDSTSQTADGGRVSNLGVGPWGEGVVLVAKEGGVDDPDVRTWTASTPAGPFHRQTALTLPVGKTERYVYYTPNIHPQLRLESGLTLASTSRSTNGGWSEFVSDAYAYKPQFTEEQLPEVAPTQPPTALEAKVRVVRTPLRTPTVVRATVTADGQAAYGRPVVLRSDGLVVGRAHTDAYGVARIPISSVPARVRLVAYGGFGQADAVASAVVAPG